MPPLREEKVLIKACTKCGLDLPIDMFGRDISKADGLKPVCRTCRNAEQIERQRLKDKKKIHRVTDATLELTEHAVEQTRDPRLRQELAPHLASVYEKVMTAWGGAEGFARTLRSQYDNAPEGSAMRNKILDIIWKMAEKCSEQQWVQRPLEDMTDDELEEYVQMRRIEIARRAGITIHDVELTPKLDDGNTSRETA